MIFVLLNENIKVITLLLVCEKAKYCLIPVEKTQAVSNDLGNVYDIC